MRMLEVASMLTSRATTTAPRKLARGFSATWARSVALAATVGEDVWPAGGASVSGSGRESAWSASVV